MEDFSKKVSVVVPVYNCEEYLDRCVQSIVDQTYCHLEIILVDDGSEDRGGEKCDEWKHRDSRIKVIHRENGGLSAARNSGIEASTGDYLLFVDSDDWIHRDMVLSMIAYSDRADIVCCGMFRATDTDRIPIKWFTEAGAYSGEEAMDLLINRREFTSHIPKNIFARELFNTIRFPEGKIYEDIRIFHKVLMLAEQVYIIPESYYFYYVREDSITNTVALKNRLEWYYALQERAKDLEHKKAQYQEKLKAQRAVVIALAIVQVSYTDEEKVIYTRDLREIRHFLKAKGTHRAVWKYATRVQYIYYWMARIFFFSANKGYRLVRGGK